ncbi:hypothetical protein AAES_160326 [Amazona aestiva]|uniref:FAM192A/Fyv6 N-terminal domain-containing protein n=1 Tax=Amazona aestiva TaxID=12930 RepID=A0A0Q3T0H1_AMAAE|nr:hypothetical protein AAES_160326 [Amazona aestiva]
MSLVACAFLFLPTGCSIMDGADGTADLVINKRFVSESELEERRKRRQEEWEKVRKPGDPEECPEEAYDPRSLYERLQEQREKKQQEFEEQFKFIHSTLTKVGVSMDPKKETEKKLPMKSVENKNKFSQAKLLAGAVKHRSSDGGNSVKRLKLDTDHDEKNQGTSLSEKPSCVPLGSSSVGGSAVHCPSAAVCIGILPGLGAYSGSSDSESSSDSEGTINSTGKIVSSVFRSNNFFDGP